MMTPAKAEELAVAALLWIADKPERAGAFLGATGAGAADLRQRAGDPQFLGFVLDFLLTSDDMVVEFSGENGSAPEAVMEARAALPGGALPNWT